MFKSLLPKHFSVLCHAFMLLYLAQNLAGQMESANPTSTYIVHFSKDQTAVASSQEGVLYAYKHVMNGYAAALTEAQLEATKQQTGFVSARPEKILSMQTTHSQEFLGLHMNFGLWSDANFGKGIIIGVLDSGIKPEHPSFSDEGLPPPPSKWRGNCDFEKRLCTNKLIGARNFLTNEGGKQPFDTVGHGTHMASVAAGNFVNNASVFGNAQGTASGAAPYAHLAIYKVCDEQGCPESAILAAMDTAIEDGVDVISLSLGGDSARYCESFISVGAFAAMQRGILVSSPAGNGGPIAGTLINEAPWLLTVGASTIDRRFLATLQFGNNEEYDTESLVNPKDSSFTLSPLAYGGLCEQGSLNKTDLKGKVIVCDENDNISSPLQADEVKNAGGSAMILVNQILDDFSLTALHFPLPATHVSSSAGKKIKEYINSTSNPTATIQFKGTVIGDSNAPALASFSARGPNMQSVYINKPDLIAPGVDILAAWPNSVDNFTNSNATFNIISGTSISSSHVSGIAALIKSLHPDWSPAAIKSAMMTTADLINLGGKPIEDETLKPAAPSDIGAGHVNPSKAIDPGLVYDIDADAYISFLCGSDFDDEEVSFIVQSEVECSERNAIPQIQLNNPSFSLALGLESYSQTIIKTLTNVGPANSKYTVKVEIQEPSPLKVVVNPSVITFTEVNQKVTYSVDFSLSEKTDVLNKEGLLKWISDKHTVTSAISVDFF